MTGPRTRTGLRAARAIGLALIALGLSWALALAIFGGFEFTVGAQTITSNEPLRPLAIAAVGLTAVMWSYGFGRSAARWESLIERVNEGVVAALLAAAVFGVGVVYGSTTAAAADSYGYVSQSDLWNAGDLRVEQPWVADVPWPEASWTFSPLGYRPAQHGPPGTIVPTYPPGLPLMMAAARRLGGQEAMFWIVPLFAGALVLATYGLGCRLGSPLAGLAGAWLVAVSPATLFMAVLPMTDVPVAATWAIAFYFLLGPRLGHASAAGALAGLAILIRPNLALQALVMGLWYLVRIPRDGARVARQGAAFAACALPGIGAVAVINAGLYGSPFASGYGALGELFSPSYILTNLRLYSGWLVERHSIVVLAGVVAVFVPLRRFWPAVPDRRALPIVAVFVAAVWMSYLCYRPFESWSYLRFLLPSWPFIMIGTGAVAVSAYRTRRPAFMLASVGIVLAAGVFELRQSVSESAFEMWHERRFASVAREIADVVAPNSVVLTKVHSGSVRYYGGRMTMRYDYLDREWLDRSIRWLAERGVDAYALLEPSEADEFRNRFKGQALVAALDAAPRLRYRAGEAETLLFRVSEIPEATIDRRL